LKIKLLPALSEAKLSDDSDICRQLTSPAQQLQQQQPPQILNPQTAQATAVLLRTVPTTDNQGSTFTACSSVFLFLITRLTR
jgi:hypothetical protein